MDKLFAFTAWEVEIQEDLLAQEETQQCTPDSAEIREFLLFSFFSFILPGNTRYGGWISERYPPHATFRWTTAAYHSVAFSSRFFLVLRMMFYDLNDGYIPDATSFFSFFFCESVLPPA